MHGTFKIAFKILLHIYAIMGVYIVCPFRLLFVILIRSTELLMPTPPSAESTAMLCVIAIFILFMASLWHYHDLITALQFTVRVMITMIIIMFIASVVLALMTAHALTVR